MVGCTSADKYRKFIEKDPGLERRFQVRCCWGNTWGFSCCAAVHTSSVRVCVLQTWCLFTSTSTAAVARSCKAHQQGTNLACCVCAACLPACLQLVNVDAPNVQETISILRGLRHK